MDSYSINNYPIPSHVNIYNQLPYKEIYLSNTWLLIPNKLIKLINDFIMFKTIYGSNVEQNFYTTSLRDQGSQHMSTETFIKRLFEKRPLAFTGSADSYILRDGTRGVGNWESIGTDHEHWPLVLSDYLSYDEIEISAFLNVSCFTPFLNNGSRKNCGKPSRERQADGVYIGQVGARFQKYSKMEYRFMMITKEQNTVENGYGPNNTSTKGLFLSLWANFFEIDYFPTYDEVMDNKQHWLGHNNMMPPSALNVVIYKKRIQICAEVFLREANDRCRNLQKKAFCHVVGLGLGVWAFDQKLQEKITIEAYIDILNNNKFKYISDLYFAWFNNDGSYNWPNVVNNINIHLGTREPADVIEDTNKFLIANWAWDANSYVGNEFWDKFLSTSGDPAAASCSFIGFLCNPDVNKISDVHVW